MKKVLIAVGVLVVLAVAALVILPSLVPADKIRAEIVAQVKAATGRDLTIDGKVAVSAFPSLSVQVNSVALSNPPGFQGKDLVRLGALDVRLRLLPILSGKVEVDSFVLLDPVVTLEVDRQGRANWTFDTAKDKGEPKPVAKSESKGESKGGGAPLSDVSLGQVRVDNGKLSYIDAKSGTREEIDGINLSIDLKSLDSPLRVKGGLKYHGKQIDLGAEIARPRALLDGTATPAELSLATEAVKLGFKGEAAGAAAKGDLDLSVPSVRGLVLWATGKPLDAPGAGLGPFALKGRLAAGGTKVSLTQAVIALDAIKANGDFTVDNGGPRPGLRGKLDVEALDLNPYLPAEQPAGKAAAPAAPGGGAAGGKTDWSDAPIDVSALRAADVDFALAVGSLTVKQIKVGKSALRVVLDNGRLTADLSQLELYKGAGKGKVVVDASQGGSVGVDAAFLLKGLAAEPFLADAAGFDRLSGTGNFDVQVAGRGKSERALVSSLNGKGALSFLDGAIKGINLAEMVRNVTTAFSGGGGAQKTDFAELGGTFTIANGIVVNKDLALKSPLLRVEGAGSVELPPRTVHYRVEPKAVASLQGQGGKSDLGGVTVPVIIEGPWDNLGFRPDLEAMVKGKATEAIQGAIGGKLPGNLLGGSSGSADGQKSGPLPINPGSLFGR